LFRINQLYTFLKPRFIYITVAQLAATYERPASFDNVGDEFGSDDMSADLRSFAGRTALIIGGTSGIGRATVLAFARRGAHVYFAGAGARDGQNLAAEAAQLGPGGVAFREIDVRIEDDVRNLVDAAVARFGRIDIAINNAGVETKLGAVQDATAEDFDRVIGTNLRGVWLGLKYQIRHMLSRDGAGAIVNTSSTAGVTGIAHIALYTASKHAIVGLTKAAALELARSKIRVNAVAPGPVQTGLLSRMLDGKVSLDEVAERVPMGRISQPEEIAEAILWLASDSASYVTGHTLIVDGGLTAA
jgi:NAD(P)-dependent dehydrogenase (short-subunit alcohol dehydrogenase family)